MQSVGIKQTVAVKNVKKDEKLLERNDTKETKRKRQSPKKAGKQGDFLEF